MAGGVAEVHGDDPLAGPVGPSFLPDTPDRPQRREGKEAIDRCLPQDLFLFRKDLGHSFLPRFGHSLCPRGFARLFRHGKLSFGTPTSPVRCDYIHLPDEPLYYTGSAR